MKMNLKTWAHISRVTSDQETFDMSDPIILPDCMMPDGGDPCQGYQQLQRDLEGLRASHEANLQYADRLERQLDDADRRLSEAVVATQSRMMIAYEESKNECTRLMQALEKERSKNAALLAMMGKQ